MTDAENKTLNEVYKAVIDLNTDIKDQFRDIKDQIRDLKDEMKDLKNENMELIEMLADELEDNEPATMLDKAMVLAEKQPELANKLIDKFGDKISTFLDTFGNSGQ